MRGVRSSSFALFGEYKKCLRTVGQIRSLQSEYWSDLSWNISLVRLVANWELGNSDVLDSLFLNLKRTSQKTELLFPKAFCDWFEKQVYRTNTDWRIALDEYEMLFNTLLADPKEKLVAEVFDMRRWLKAKALKKPLSEVYFADPPTAIGMRRSV